MVPSAKAITLGIYKQIDGVWHKRCTGPQHDETPIFLPANEKYFFVRKSRIKSNGQGTYGQLSSRCRLCEAYANVKVSTGYHGWVPTWSVIHYYAEAVNRIGLAELARRTELQESSITAVLTGKTRNVRKNNLRKVMLELVSIRRKNENSINVHSLWRVTRRGAQEVCIGCGTPSSNYTEGCAHCVDRRRQRAKRTKSSSR